MVSTFSQTVKTNAREIEGRVCEVGDARVGRQHGR